MGQSAQHKSYKIPSGLKTLKEILAWRDEFALKIIADGESFYDQVTGEFFDPDRVTSFKPTTDGNAMFLPPGWSVKFVTPVKCEYCGRVGFCDVTCAGCGAPWAIQDISKQINEAESPSVVR